MTKTIRVGVPGASHDVVIGYDILQYLPRALRRVGVGPTIGVVTDSTVARTWLGPLRRALEASGHSVIPVVLRPGERRKTLQTVGSVCGRLLRAGVGRDGCILALGGGVIGDLAGFVAATYQRGIPVVQVPTTLLAQVDSALGGKVGVNHALGKNMIGAFHQPTLVWSDTACLRTLPRRELIGGLGEVVKYGIISDRRLFEWLESNLDRVFALSAAGLRFVVERSASIKARVVAADEREHGLRVILNHGHTVGHALEAAAGYGRLRHGEAVLLGMRIEAQIAAWMGLLSEEHRRRIVGLIDRVPVAAPRLSLARVLGHMGRDKKNRRGVMRFVLATAIGRVQVVERVDPALIADAIRASVRTRG
ncbi:MAG: 3-dehydroquinate synthase [Bacteroidetes bacterium]|jgi:3-dehydroquinate synthase|nr:3-dehydroquinate synthase [Bacteroidota bacterium]